MFETNMDEPNNNGFASFISGLGSLATAAAPIVTAFRGNGSNGGQQDTQAAAQVQAAQSREASTSKTLLYVGLGLVGAVVIAVIAFAFKRR